MVPELILIALLVGWLMHGKFWRLADADIKFIYLIFVPLLLQVVSWVPSVMNISWFAGTSAIVEKLVLVFVAIANWRMPGMRVILAGLVINTVALCANHGIMPADPHAVAAAFGQDYLNQTLTAPHIRSAIMDTSCELGFLCDIISAHRPFALFPAVYSIGDLITTSGIFIAIIGIMRTPLPSEKNAPEGA